MSGKSLLTTILLLVVVIVGFKSVYIVQETERAVKLRFGEVVNSDVQAGLHFLIPFVNKVRIFDGRLITMDSPPSAFLTSEKKRLIVDSFVKWHIVDVEKYYTATSGDLRRATDLISVRVETQLRNQFGTRTLNEVVSGEREKLMAEVKLWLNDPTAARAASADADADADADATRLDGVAESLGVEIVDVRIKKVELPPEVSSSVYQRMRTERERLARELRSRGKEVAEGIRADADRLRTILLAEAYKTSETTRGIGDASAAATYANAYQADPEFYKFTRSLKAYTESFSGGGDVMLLKPNSEFFKYFSKPGVAN
ncbi:MAG: protease modulator HflC [Pseudomonadales bacterium]|nr:protease modulator HflC [Pseudomonadales bacterium]NRA16780.1 protease modulator HflC [Oceanospirillaceae bacterium]